MWWTFEITSNTRFYRILEFFPNFSHFSEFFAIFSKFFTFFSNFFMNLVYFQYLTYITTVTAEIPAAILTYLILDNVGRRKALCYTTVVAGACLITAAFMPPHHPAIIRAILFVGMMAEASAFTILYVFTAELWPTQFRSMLTNICAMVGRIGSIIAPLSVLMVGLSQVLMLKLADF